MHLQDITFASDVRQYFIDELAAERFVVDKTGVKTIELIGASFIASLPAIFGEVNEDYVQRELEWYKSKSLSVYDIPGGPPKIWQEVADKAGYINSNYGWCIWSDANYNQYNHVIAELKKHRESRRAVLIYTRPEMWFDYKFFGRSDFMCTNTVQYLIRDDVLNVVVQMRSNDVIFGYRNDFAWQDYVAKLIQEELDCKDRKIIWNVGSLHVYERHFNMVK